MPLQEQSFLCEIFMKKGFAVLGIFLISNLLSFSESQTSKIVLFPLEGVTLGKTTRSELRRLGGRKVRKNDCYEIDDYTFWYDKDSSIVDFIGIAFYDPMPELWQDQGLHWDLSYNEWLELFENAGYTIDVFRGPYSFKWKDNFSLFAEVHAYSPDESPIVIILDFGFSTEYGTDSPGTISDIFVSWRSQKEPGSFGYYE